MNVAIVDYTISPAPAILGTLHVSVNGRDFNEMLSVFFLRDQRGDMT